MQLSITIHQPPHPESLIQVVAEPGLDIDLLERLDVTPRCTIRLAQLEPRVAVVDVRDLPLGALSVLLRMWGQASPTTRFLAIGEPGDEEMARHAVAAGASAYLTRDHSASAVSQALRSIVRGGWHLGPTGKRAVARLLGGRP